MSIADWVIIGAGGLVGWGVVWGVITLINQQRKPPYDPNDPER